MVVSYLQITEIKFILKVLRKRHLYKAEVMNHEINARHRITDRLFPFESLLKGLEQNILTPSPERTVRPFSAVQTVCGCGGDVCSFSTAAVVFSAHL